MSQQSLINTYRVLWPNNTTGVNIKSSGGQVHGWDGPARFGVKEARHLDRFAQFALAAAQDAVADSGINFEAYPPERSGVMIGPLPNRYESTEIRPGPTSIKTTAMAR